jgi:hypothetical protein
MIGFSVKNQEFNGFYLVLRSCGYYRCPGSSLGRTILEDDMIILQEGSIG